ncbi:MAG: porin family protein [Pseudomonadaceae bacterium]
MFKKTLFAATMIGLCATSAFSHAQEAQPYLFASLGQSDADISTSDIVPKGAGISSSMDNKDTAWKIGAGLKLNQYFAFEAEYVDLGEVAFRATDGNSAVRLNAGTEGYGLNGVLTMPLDSFSLFAKVGYHRLETDFDISASGLGSISDSQTEWVTSFGVGGGYNLGERVTLVAEFERYRDVGDEYDVDLLSAGIRYNF